MKPVVTHLIAVSIGFWISVAIETKYRWTEHAVARHR